MKHLKTNYEIISAILKGERIRVTPLGKDGELEYYTPLNWDDKGQLIKSPPVPYRIAGPYGEEITAYYCSKNQKFVYGWPKSGVVVGPVDLVDVSKRPDLRFWHHTNNH